MKRGEDESKSDQDIKTSACVQCTVRPLKALRQLSEAWRLSFLQNARLLTALSSGLTRMCAIGFEPTWR